MIEILPGTVAPARVVIAQALEEAKDDDTVFIVLISGDDIHISSSGFKTRDICWASQLLEANASAQVVK